MPDDKIPAKLTMREIVLKGSVVAIIVTIPSITAFLLVWFLFNNPIYGIILGTMVYFAAMTVALKISKRFLVKQ